MPSKRTVYKWLSGLVVSVVGGLVIYIKSGQDSTSIMAGLMVLLAYLVQHPLPEPEDLEK